jgi:hypothetical protein
MRRSIALLGLLSALGCAGRATSVAEAGGASSASGGATGGSGGSTTTSASAGAGGNASAGASGPEPGCSLSCPAPFFALHLAVNSSGSSSNALTNVQATLSGPATVVLVCETQIETTLCFATESGPEGNYSLQVTAPGFQSVTMAATVTFAPGPGCGCATATLQPTGVVLFPLAP